MQNRTPLPRPSRLFFTALAIAASYLGVQMEAQTQDGNGNARQPTDSSSAPPTTEHITAIVLSSVDGKPVPRVLVFTPSNRMAAMTDSEGRFSFDFRRTASPADALQTPQVFSTFPPSAAPAAGQAEVTANFILRKPGYVNSQVVLRLPAAQPQTPGPALELHITPAAIITGHVYGESGRDLPAYTSVELRRRQPAQGLPAWIPAGGALVDSRGDFRFPNLPPGDYKLLVSGSLPPEDPAQPAASPTAIQMSLVPPGSFRPAGPGHIRQQEGSQPQSRKGFLPSYYANADSLDSAAIIHAGPGESAAANLTLRSAPFYSITIPTAGLPKTQPGFSVNIQPDTPGVFLRPRGDQLTGYLPNGTYELLLVAQQPREAIKLAPRPAGTASIQYLMPNVHQSQQQQYASVTLRVEGHAVQTEPAVFHPAMEIPITVHRDLSATQTAQLPPTSIFLTLESLLSGVPGALLPNQSDATDDNLTLPNVLPGLFHVAVSPRIPAYVASLTSGGTDLLREPLRVLPGVSPQPIEITLRDDFASLAAHVAVPPGVAAQSLIAASIHIVCIPLDRSQDRPQYSTQAKPQFTLTNLAPGRYLILAYAAQQLDELAWQDSDVLRDLIPKGVTVNLTAGQQSQAEVPLLPESPQ